jgi:branched-subunit amino acid permease
MIELRMNIWWENIVQLGIPLLIILVPIVVAIILVRKEKLKTQLPND